MSTKPGDDIVLRLRAMALAFADAWGGERAEALARDAADELEQTRAQLATVTAERDALALLVADTGRALTVALRERDVALLVIDMPRSVFDEETDVAAEAACAAYDARWRVAGLCGLHPWVSARCAAGPHGLPARALPGCQYASCATHCRCAQRTAQTTPSTVATPSATPAPSHAHRDTPGG